MLTTLYQQSDLPALYSAPVDKFTLLRSQILSGDRLAQIRALQRSIARFGLLSPIVVVERGAQLIVVDGRKRLAALRRLAFQGRLPRSLANIPYLRIDPDQPQTRRPSILIRNRALFEAVRTDHEAGQTLNAIAARFSISRQCVRDLLGLTRLSAPMRQQFFSGVIDFAQARAYAALPSAQDQYALFCRLGADASPDAIMCALQDGNEVIPTMSPRLSPVSLSQAA